MIYFVCDFLGSNIPFLIMLYFFSKYHANAFRWSVALAWTALWYVSFKILITNLSFANTFLFALLFLVLYGKIMLKQNLIHTLVVSIFFLSIFYWSNAANTTIGYGIAKQIGKEYPEILRFLDIFLIFFSIFLLYLFLYSTQGLFQKSLCYLQNKIMLLLICPVLFVAVSEQILVRVVYGDTIVWDTQKGLIYPQVRIMPILCLHILAGAVLGAIIFLFWQMEHSITIEQKNRILEQQTQAQEIYVQEAQHREEQMASFRHDMHNHFLVLHELLQKGKTAEAVSYLADFQGMTDSFSCISYTGNSVIDVLLHSKFSIAQQKGIEIVCELCVPKLVADIDWCILLGNAVDNALCALEKVKTDRRLRIYGRMQGDFFYLQIENTCYDLQMPIKEGIGLSNIRTMVQKYGGTLETDYCADMFRLNILLHLSPQEKRI